MLGFELVLSAIVQAVQTARRFAVLSMRASTAICFRLGAVEHGQAACRSMFKAREGRILHGYHKRRYSLVAVARGGANTCDHCGTPDDVSGHSQPLTTGCYHPRAVPTASASIGGPNNKSTTSSNPIAPNTPAMRSIAGSRLSGGPQPCTRVRISRHPRLHAHHAHAVPAGLHLHRDPDAGHQQQPARARTTG